MVQASGAEVLWDGQKKAWVVRIQVGGEVVRRTCKDSNTEMTDEQLRSLALQTATDDGYELAADRVTITR